MTIGERIKARRKELNLSAEEVAQKLGVNRATVYRYESNGIEKLPTKLIKPLAEALHVSEGYLMGWDDGETNLWDIYPELRPIQMRRVPMLGKIACGEPIFDEERDCFVEISSNINCDFCLTCKGDSMINARIYDGDVVYIRSMDMVDNGRIAAVAIDGEVTLKRVYYYKEKNKLVLNPENPAYEPFVYTGEELNNVRILGLAVAFTSAIK